MFEPNALEVKMSWKSFKKFQADYENTASQAPFRTDRQNSLAMKIFYVPLMRCDLSTVMTAPYGTDASFICTIPGASLWPVMGFWRSVRFVTWLIPGVGQSNETEPKISRIQSNPIGRICCSISSVIEHNWTGTFWWVRLANSIEQIDAIL